MFYETHTTSNSAFSEQISSQP